MLVNSSQGTYKKSIYSNKPLDNGYTPHRPIIERRTFYGWKLSNNMVVPTLLPSFIMIFVMQFTKSANTVKNKLSVKLRLSQNNSTATLKNSLKQSALSVCCSIVITTSAMILVESQISSRNSLHLSSAIHQLQICHVTI